MEIVLLKHELNTVLSLFSRISNKGLATPILGSTLFAVNGNEVTLTCYNLEYGASIKLLTTNLNTERHSFCVDTSMLSSIVAKCREEVRFKIDENSGIYSNKLEVSSKSSVYTVTTIGAGDYPDIPVLESGEFVSFEAEKFVNGIKHTLYCVGDDEDSATKNFSGLNVLAENNTLYFRAVDGFRAVEYGVEIEKVPDPFYATIRRNVVKFLLDIANKAGTEGNIMVGRNTRHITFEIGDYTIFSRLLERDKMDLTPFRNKKHSNTAVIETAVLLEALEQVEPTIENVAKNPTKMVCNENNISLTTVSSLGKSQTSCQCEWEGSALTIGFNNRFFIETLKNIGCEKITIKFGGPISPIEIYDSENQNSWALVLPMRLKNNI